MKPQMNRWVDKYYPLIISAVATGIFYVLFRDRSSVLFAGSIEELLSAVITISSIGIGFLATSKSILISMQNSKIIKWMKDGGHYKNIINYTMSAIHWCFALTLISALALVFDLKAPATDKIFFLACAWVFIASAALLCSYRIVRLFSTILRLH
jgi:hypothetical protein